MPAATKGDILSLLQKNDLQEAKKRAQAFCKKNKDDAEAWFLLGTIHGHTGEAERAIECLQRSITIQDNVAVTHFNLGLIYLQMNRPADARTCFEKSLKLDPDSAASHRELANALLADGHAEESIPHYQAALKKEPHIAAALFNLSRAYHATENLPEAISCLQRGLQIQPLNPDAHFMLGNLLSETADFEGSITHYRSALQQHPDSPEILTNLGNTLLHTGANQEAIDIYKKALELKKDSADILFNLGNAYRAADDLDASEACLRRALEINPSMVAANNNLGITLHEKGLLKEAEACHLRSIVLQEDQVDAYINLASCYRDQRLPEQAINILRKALSIHPQQPELHWDMSLLLLATGKYSEGWDEYKWRSTEQALQLREFPYPEWQGEPITDKTILVTAEQGIGDEIMLASCFNDLLKESGRVILECEPRLEPLFSRSFNGASVQAAEQGSDLSWLSALQPPPDVQISAGSLPLHYRQHGNQFPAHQGYLIADPDKTRAWKQNYSRFGSVPVIGISWKGGHVSQKMRRHTELLAWEPILKLSGVAFINLQYGDTQAEREQVEKQLGVSIHHWQESDPLADMDNFAAQINAVDLVISVDNSTVHLAGALGKKTWVLQPHVADWRWMTPSETSSWYPSITQFYQPESHDWNPVLKTVSDKLEHLIRTGDH